MRHELTLIGSKINHLPAAVFRLYEILRQSCAGQYEESGDGAPTFDKEQTAYIAGDVTLTPDNMVVTVAYEETETEGQFRYAVRIADPQAYRGRSTNASTAAVADADTTADTNDGESASAQAYESTLTMPCGMAFLQRYYYPVRRFLRANPAKYDRPGIPGRPREGMTIAVLDTEMQRPYVTQFSGCLLRYRGGAWTTDDRERLNVYVRLPEGVRVDPFVRRVTGLTREFLDEHGVSEREALTQITAFLNEAEIICGHSVLADIEILRERYLYAGYDTSQLPACLQRDDLIDTQVLMEYLYDLQGMIKLERAAELAGVANEDDVFHDARTDADVTARLFMALNPAFIERYGVMPVVKADMMHAPREVAFLNAILGKRVPAGIGTGSHRQGRETTPRGKASRSGGGVRRSVHAEQQRKRTRIT